MQVCPECSFEDSHDTGCGTPWNEAVETGVTAGDCFTDTITVSGANGIYIGDDSYTDTLTLTPDTNITITTDANSDTITFTNCSPKVSMSKEQVQTVLADKEIPAEPTEDGKISKSIGMSITKAPKGKTQESYEPTDEELAKINGLALTTQTKDSVRVFTFHAADDQLDRAYEHFSKKALQGMADLAVKNSIPMLMDHEWKTANINGRVFDANVKAGKLLYKTYVPVIDKTKGLLEAIYSGIYSKLSVGFSINLEDYTCDSCSKSMFLSECPHMPGGTDEKGNTVTATIKGVNDNLEISLVPIPCQPGAHIQRSLGEGTDFKITYDADTLIKMAKGIQTHNTEIFTTDTIESDINKDIGMTDLTKDTPAEVTTETEATAAVETVETKETPAEVIETKAPEAPAVKEVVVKLDTADFAEVLKSLVEQVGEINKKLEEANAKLEIAMTASTDSLTKKLDELRSEKTPQTASKHFVLDRFSVDLGGRKE